MISMSPAEVPSFWLVYFAVEDIDAGTEMMFDALLSMDDPLELIKWKDVYALLESTLDECESVAEIMESISIKNS